MSLNNDAVKRVDSLTGIRFFAAAWVVIFHFREYDVDKYYRIPIFDWFVKFGGLGVDLFFALSGFIMSYVYFEKFKSSVSTKDYLAFLVARIARIYPIHLLTLAIMLIMFSVWKLKGGGDLGADFNLVGILSSLTLTHAWIGDIVTPNRPAWSISAEFFAYLIFPMLLLLSRKSKIFTAMLLLSACAALILYQIGFAIFINKDLLRIFGGFTIGMITYGTLASIFNLRNSAICTALEVLAFGTIGAAIYFISQEITLAFAIIFSATILLMFGGTGYISRALSTRFIVYLGEISYSIYMVHWPIRIIVRWFLKNIHAFDIIHPFYIIAIYAACSLLAAMATFHFVEEPARRWIRENVTFR